MQDRIKVVIVDDEPQSIHRLQDDLATLEDFEVIATSSSAVSAKNLVMSIQPDVLFIDVEMPGQTGFEVLQSLRDEIPMELIVVFYSAFDKYMIDALRASAFDFLLKPYQQDEFELVVDRIRQKMKDGDDVDEDASSVPESSSCSSESVLASQKAQDFSGMNGMLGTAAKRLAIQTISGLLMLKPDDVFSCTFDEVTHLWQLKLSNGQVYKLKRQVTAKTILSMSPSLAQVRQDCIINLDYLLCIENYTLRCIFSPPFDQEEITVFPDCCTHFPNCCKRNEHLSDSLADTGVQPSGNNDAPADSSANHYKPVPVLREYCSGLHADSENLPGNRHGDTRKKHPPAYPSVWTHRQY
jgi:two-component system, LytTR family, response regulator